MNTKLIIVGGFLGAGKTTAILSMAKHFMQTGLKIGIVTNDQGSQLVDTHFLRANGLEVLSVEGGCFCCNFDEFTQKIAELRGSKDIDILLAEPVGSCTDLIATIFKPLLKNKAPMLDKFEKEFALAPLSIVADPKRIKRLMMQERAGNDDNGDGDGDKGTFPSTAAFPTEVNYLFDKQLQEAGIIIINKCDTLPSEEIYLIEAFLRHKYPGIDVLRVSAKTGSGLKGWIDRIMHTPYTPGGAALQIDYGAYARAEAALGWLNALYFITADIPADINCRAREFMKNICAEITARNTEIAHVKCYCIGQHEFYKASITGTNDELDESSVMTQPQKNINLIINARVNIDPDLLRRICEDAIIKAFPEFSIQNVATENFRPAPPNPTYRLIDQD